MTRKGIVLTALLMGLAVLPRAHAQEVGEVHEWQFDAVTIGRGYTVSSPDDTFHVGVLPDVLKGETSVTIKIFDHVEYEQRLIHQVNTAAEAQRLQMEWAVPEGKVIISPIYEFDIKGAADLYDPTKPLWLRFHYDAATNDNKGVYFWDKGHQQWVLIPTLNHAADQSLRAAIHLTYAPIAILADEIPKEGIASWYRYHGCNCAASRHYPAGTLLQVTDIDTGRQVVVEVNDFGPEEWTGRIIDLDLVAFEQLAKKGKGLTNVRVEPYLPTEQEIADGALQLYVHE